MSSICSSRTSKILKRIGIGLAAAVVVLVVAVEVLLQTGALTGLVCKYVSPYVDGELRVGRVTGSILTHFPKARLVLEDVSVTYPHDKFSYARGVAPDRSFTDAGRGAMRDTLLAFRTLDATVSWLDALRGAVTVKRLTLDEACFFLHDYGNGITNLAVFGGGGAEEEPAESEETEETPEEEAETPAEEGSSELFPLTLRDISITGHPRFVYTAAADGTYYRIDAERLLLEGTFSTVDAEDTRLNLTAGALSGDILLPGDTLGIVVPELSIRELDADRMALRILADADLALDGLGRMLVPLGVESEFTVPEGADGTLPIHFDWLTARAASVEAAGSGDILIAGDRFGTDVDLRIEKTSLRQLCRFLAQLDPAIGDIDTDASLSAEAALRGDFADGQFPAIDARLRVPENWIYYPGMVRRGRLGLDARLRSDDDSRWNLGVDTLSLHADGIHTGWSAGMLDLLGDDPLVRLHGFLDTSADSLSYLIGVTGMDVDSRGSLALRLDGESRLSSFDAVRYPEARLTGHLAVRGLVVNDRTDDLRLFLPKADVDLRTMENRFDTSIPQGTQVLGVKADIDTVHFRYGVSVEARGRDVMLAAQNSVLSYGDDGPMGRFTPFMVFLKADRFGYKDGEDFVVGMSGSKSSFRVASDEVDRSIPRITLESRSRSIFLREGVSRYSFGRRLLPAGADTARLHGVRFAENPNDVFVNLKVSAKLNTFEKTRRRRAFADSLRRMYPGVPKDSLFVRWRNDRFGAKIPSWMQNDEFSASDISVDLGEDLMAYLRDWDVDGHAYIGGGAVVTPYFPLGTQVDTLAADFTLDEIRINEGRVQTFHPRRRGEEHSGEDHRRESELGFSGTVSNLRHAVMGIGPYRLDLRLDSGYINADELMSAAAAGQNQDVEAMRDSLAVLTVDDERYEQLVVADSVAHDLPDIDLFVIPSNLVANVVIDFSNVDYQGETIEWFTGDCKVQDRILLLTNVVGRSSVGNLFLDTFYATQSMDEIGGGLDLVLYEVDAGKVCELFPEICESSEGYVNKLSGNLETQIAVVTRFDPRLNVDYSTLNGVFRVTGGERNDTKDARRNLVIHNGPELRSLARWLPFVSPSRIPIRNLEASVIVEDGQLEILPMMVENRWYGLSIAGVQNLDPDQAFKYTVSVIKSPLLFPFGLNLKGDDVGSFDYDLVGSKYWRVRKIPTLDSRKKVEQSVDLLYGAIVDIFTLGVDGVIGLASPSRFIRELKEENEYEFSFLEEEMDEGDEAELRQMRASVEDITSEEYVTREMEAIRKETMSKPLKKRDEQPGIH